MKIDKVYYSPGWQLTTVDGIPFENHNDMFLRVQDANMPKGANKFEIEPGKFYTIEPVEVEILKTCKWHGNRDACGNETCWDLNECQNSPPLFFARILPKVEKTAPYRDTPWGGEIPDTEAAFPQFQKCSILQETPTVATDHTVFQPAPVVDKPAGYTSNVKQALQDKIKQFEAFKTDSRYQSEMEQNAVIVTLRELRYLDSMAETVDTQPTEWIPVPDKQTISVPLSLIPQGAKLVEAYETTNSITVMFGPGEEIPDFHNCDEMGCGSFSHVKYRLSLPEPPKQ